MAIVHIWSKYNLRWVKALIFSFAILLLSNSIAQSQKSINNKKGATTFNLTQYEQKWIHYGMQLGFFSSSMRVKYSDLYANTPTEEDGLIGVYSSRSPGFTIGFVLNVGLPSILWDFRFQPNISLYERSMEYTYVNQQTEIKKSEVTMLEFPLLLKYKSLRRNNHLLYMIGGISPSFRVGGKIDDPLNNLAYGDSNVEVVYGFGFHMYMQIFNFAPEIRFSHGLANIFKKNNNEFSDQLRAVYTHKVSIILNFEG